MKFFDSLVHATEDGTWLGGTRYDAGIDRLQKELERVAPCRACLVSIAGYQDNDVLERFARARPDLYVPIAGFDPSSIDDTSGVAAAIARLSERGFAGIKLHPRLNGYDPMDDRCLEAIQAAGQSGLVVFLDTLFRQQRISTRHPADVIDNIATSCPETRMVLLHGGGAHLLGMFEMVRMHDHLLLDLSFTLLRYAGSSLDLDIRFLCEALDQRLTVGSDFPEYTPAEALARMAELTEGLAPDKCENILFRNLESLFGSWAGMPGTRRQ